MGIRKILGRAVPAAAALVLVAGFALVFLLRPPAIIVTDPSFDLLYGMGRARLRQAALSIRHFRRVIAVQVAESAGPEIAAAAVNAFSSAPNVVLFSGLFSESARRYQAEKPETPVFLWEGSGLLTQVRRDESVEAGPRAARVDRELDMRRAGIAAAFLARESGGRICVYQDQPLARAERAAFGRGLESGGFDGTPLYLNLDAGFQNGSCAVIMGAAAGFFGENSRIPVVLFSWLDPLLTPGNVKVIFDDSPWTALGEILRRSAGAPSPLPVASRIIIPKERAVSPEDAASLEKLMKTEPSVGTNEQNL